MKAIVLYLFLIPLFVCSCASSKCTTSAQEAKSPTNHNLIVNDLAKEKYGDSFTIQENETKEFYLVSSHSKSATETAIKFFVFEKESQLMILEDFIPLGVVKWINSYTVSVQKFPGTVKLNETGTNQSGYLFDVKTKQKK